MKLEHSAFTHVPQLRDKIRDPETSRFRNLDMTRLDQRAREAGYPPDWRRSDAEREATRDAALSDRAGEDLWIFAYGSLMWDPGFYFDEVRVARAEGYQRSFCLKMKIGRGSPENPGLMAALDLGQACDGLVFRIRAEHVEPETQIIWRREMIGYGYVPTFVPLETRAGPVEALTFVVDRESGRYAGGLDVDHAARLIARAHGINGTNLEYLDNLAAQLDLLELEDEGFVELYRRIERYRPSTEAVLPT